jgi:hypothetical protein
MAPLFAIIPYALLETFFCIPILPKTALCFKYESFMIVVAYNSVVSRVMRKFITVLWVNKVIRQ